MLFVNSSKKTSGITSQFNITLPRPITNARAYEIVGAEIPYSFYDIWPGNTGIADITPIGSTEPQTFYNIAYQNTPSFFWVWNYQQFTFIFNNVIHTITTTSPSETYPSSGDVSGFNFIGESIMAANIPGITSCTVSIINYRLNLRITTTIVCFMLGLLLQGTNVQLASFIGLSQNTITNYSGGTTAANIYLPSTYNPYTADLITYYTRNIQSYFIIGSTTYHIDGYTNDGLYVTKDNDPYTDSSITVNPEKHYLGYILGYNGTYANSPGLGVSSIPFTRLPIHYDLRIFIQALGPDASPSSSLPPGYYTGDQIVTQLNAIIQTSAEFKNTVFSYNSSSKLISVTVNTATPHSSLSIGNSKYGSYVNLFEKLGFAPGVHTVTGVNITTATFHAIYPYNPGTQYLYICSNTLSNITDSKVSTDTIDPMIEIDNIIHKVQVNVKPTKLIRDNGKFAIRKTLVKSFQPITSIDFELRDQDLQLVNLNGRFWSLSIRFII